MRQDFRVLPAAGAALTGLATADAIDGARQVIFYDRRATCWHRRVKGLTIMVNSLFNSWRMEDVWLDK